MEVPGVRTGTPGARARRRTAGRWSCARRSGASGPTRLIFAIRPGSLGWATAARRRRRRG